MLGKYLDGGQILRKLSDSVTICRILVGFLLELMDFKERINNINKNIKIIDFPY